MRLVNVVGIVVGLYLLVQSYRLVRQRREDVFSFLTWLAVGLTLVVVSLFPSITDYAMQLLGMEMRAYALFTLGILLSYILLFRLSRALWRLDRSLSDLNEELSLLKVRRSQDSNGATEEAHEEKP